MELSRRARILLLCGLLLTLLASVGLLQLQHLRVEGLPWRVRLHLRDWEAAMRTQHIHRAEVHTRIEPARGFLHGEARLEVSQSAPRTELRLLLNPGLKIESVKLAGEPALYERHGEFLIVRATALFREAQVVLRYAGEPRAVATGTPHLAPEELLLPRLSFWYPQDLESFHHFEGSVELPEGFSLALNGMQSEPSGDGLNTVHWSAARPVPGVTLAAGAYTEHRLLYGNISCHLYAEPDAGLNTEWLLATLGRLHAFYQSRFGDDGHEALVLVAAPAAGEAFHGGNALLAVPPTLLQDQEEAFLLLARLVAQNWWGGTVQPPWFNRRPAAGEWLVEGLAMYSAWEATRELRGPEELQDLLAGHPCPPFDEIVARFDLRGRFAAREAALPGKFRLRGGYITRKFAARAGEAVFDEALASLVAERAHTTITYHDLRHALEMVALRDFQDLFRLWLERPAHMDYAIAGLVQDGDAVSVDIANLGNTAATGALELALTGGGETRLHRADLPARGGTLHLNAPFAVERATLDPSFHLPDSNRFNNVWPQNEDDAPLHEPIP